MKHMRIALVLFLFAFTMIACSSKQEVIDRAVEMTIEAQQAKSAQSVGEPVATAKAVENIGVVPKQNTPVPATSTPKNTLTPTFTPANTRVEDTPTPRVPTPTNTAQSAKSSGPILSKKILGTWTYETDKERGYLDFFHFGENGELWQGDQEPFHFQYKVIDDQSIQIYSSTDNEQVVSVSMPDDNTLVLGLISGQIEMGRQPEIENLSEMLLGYWQDVQDRRYFFGFLPKQQFVSDWNVATYDVLGNMVIIADSFPLLIASIDDEKMETSEEGGPRYSLQRTTEAELSPSFAEHLIAANFFGTWIATIEDGDEEYYLWVTFEGDGTAYFGDDEYQYEVKDDVSLELSTPEYPDNSHLFVTMMDNGTIQLLIPEEDQEFDLSPQPQIKALQSKLEGVWLGEEDDPMLFLPSQEVLLYGERLPYTLRGNAIFIGESDAALVLSVDDQELMLIAGFTKIPFRNGVTIASSSSGGAQGVLFPYGMTGFDGECGYIDSRGNIVISAVFAQCGGFSDGIAVAYLTDDLGGYINTSGQFVIAPMFSNPQSFSEGLARVRNLDGLVGYIDQTGEYIIPAQFMNGENFSSGVAKVDFDLGENSTSAFINKTGNVVRFVASDEHFNYSEGFASVDVPNGCYYVDTSGQIAIQTPYDSCDEFSEGLATVEDELGCYYINTDGKVEIETQNGQCSNFSDELAAVYGSGSGHFRCGYIDKRGRPVIDLAYSQCGDFSEGVAPVETVQGYWGYIDTRGRYVFGPASVDSTYEFRDGLGRFIVNKQIGYVNTTGDIVYRPETWTDALIVDPERLSTLMPQEYYYATNTGTEYTITKYFKEIVGSKIVWSGTVQSVGANGAVAVRVDATQYSTAQDFELSLRGLDEATLSRLRNNNLITFSATLADFDTGGGRQIPKVIADKAVILSIGN